MDNLSRSSSEKEPVSKEKVNDKWVKVDGVRMLKSQRDLMIKSDYIHAGMKPKELGEKYGLSPAMISELVNKGKWVKERENFVDQIEKKVGQELASVYTGLQVEVTVMYNNAWLRLMNITEQILRDPEKHLMTESGAFKLTSIDRVAEVLRKAQEGHEKCIGFVDKAAQVSLKLREKRLNIYAKAMGEDGEEIVSDNFIEALETAGREVFVDKLPKSSPFDNGDDK